jgi:hypothetical protein
VSRLRFELGTSETDGKPANFLVVTPLRKIGEHPYSHHTKRLVQMVGMTTLGILPFCLLLYSPPIPLPNKKTSPKTQQNEETDKQQNTIHNINPD